MRRWIVVLALGACAVGCATELTLSVDLQTEQVPTEDFDEVATALFRGTGATPVETQVHRPAAGEPFPTGVRIAEFRELQPGAYSVQVELRLAGEVVAGRSTTIEVERDHGVTVVIPAEPCISLEETCDGTDQDCDGLVDEGDPAELCPAANATSSCDVGACIVAACDDGFDDCDADVSTGCEVDTTSDPAGCGACGISCDPAAVCDASKCRFAGSFVWDAVLEPDGTGSIERVTVSSLQFAGDGGAFLAGSMRGTADFGGGRRGMIDTNFGYLLKLGDDGSYQWDRLLGESVSGIGVLPDGGVVAAGQLGDPFDFGGGERAITSSSGTFIAAYDADGTYRWDVVLDGATPFDLAIDATGRSFVVGQLRDPTDFGGGVRDPGIAGRFVAGYASDGAYVFDRVFDAINFVLRSLAVSDAGVVVGGYQFISMATIDFGGGLRGVPPDAGVLVAYELDGTYRWDRIWPRLRVDAVAAGSSAFHLGAEVLGVTDLGGGAIGTDLDGLTRELVFATFAPEDGQFRWGASAFGRRGFTSASLGVSGLAVGEGGDVYAVGSFEETVDFGGGLRVHLLGGPYVVAFGPDGRHRWDRTFADPGFGNALAVGTGAGGLLGVGGRFEVGLDFGGGLRALDGTRSAFAVVLAD